LEEAVQTSIRKIRVDAVGVRHVGDVHGGADGRENRQEEEVHQGKEGVEGLPHKVVAAGGGESDHDRDHEVEVVAHQTAAEVVYHDVEVDGDDDDGVVVDVLLQFIRSLFDVHFWV
jgi:hypothetical protein